MLRVIESNSSTRILRISRARINFIWYCILIFSSRKCPYRVAIAHLIVRAYTHAYCTLAARQNEEDGNAHEYPGTPSVTSSLRLHTQTVELGPDTSRCMLDRRSFAPGSALLSSRAGYCRRNTSEQSTILPEIWRVLRASVNKPRLLNSPVPISFRLRKIPNLITFVCVFSVF